ncbi:MAG: hypothetical protein JSU75_06940 [Gammaproteobacteria bacterium]|nr:MAG: hypothetical protein JSU75_06940 [Gammaproteobacteria bacterium]
MVFAYYNSLSKGDQATYRKSDRVTTLALPNNRQHSALVSSLRAALHDEDCKAAADACQQLARSITRGLSIPPVVVRVLARRPSDDYGELHGLYDPREGKAPPLITLWMRTAKREQVVAFRSFLRTLLHELCHHIDYEYLQLAESYHTEGFYKRESSLFRQLVDVEMA